MHLKNKNCGYMYNKSPLRKAFFGAYFSPNLIFQSSHTYVCCGFQISLLQKLFSIKYFRSGLNTFKLLACFFCVFNFSVFSQTEVDRVIAVVGEQVVLQSDLDFNQNELLKTGRELKACDVFEQILLTKLMVAQAKIDSVSVSEAELKAEVELRLTQMAGQVGGMDKLEQALGSPMRSIKDFLQDPIKDNLISQRMRAKIVEGVKLTPTDVYNFYTANQDKLPESPEQIELAQLVLKAKISKSQEQKIMQEMNIWRNQVASGERNMGTIATLYSEDPGSRGSRGVLGFQARGTFVPEFEAAAYNLKQGEVSKVFKTKFGYHFLQVIERRGDQINVAHVLRKPKPTTEQLLKLQAKADSIYQMIQNQEITFEEAVLRFSQDEKTKQNQGVLINMIDQGKFFDVKQTLEYARMSPEFAYVADLIYALSELEVGEVSYPSMALNMDQETIVRMGKIVEKKTPHIANLQDDYQVVERFARQKKEEETLEKWTERILQNTFIKIDDRLQNCEFRYGWLKNK